MRGMTFDQQHSYNDLGLILSSIEDNPPKVQDNYISVPYRNTLLDMTEAFAKISYESRKPSFTFQLIKNDSWESMIRTVSSALHGKRMHITYDRDPDYYLLGRVSINSFKSNKKIGTLVIDAVCDPFKYKQDVTTDTFAVEATREITLSNDQMIVYPKITTSAEMQVVQGENSFSFNNVANYQSSIELLAGDNTLTINGTGSISFIYQEGAL